MTIRTWRCPKCRREFDQHYDFHLGCDGTIVRVDITPAEDIQPVSHRTGPFAGQTLDLERQQVAWLRTSTPALTDVEALAWLLHLVTRDEPDQHGQPSCFACHPRPWHYTVNGTTFDPETARCTCPCHTIRGRLGIDDPLAWKRDGTTFTKWIGPCEPIDLGPPLDRSDEVRSQPASPDSWPANP